MYYDVTGENLARDLIMASSRRNVYENTKTLTFEEQIVPDKKYGLKVSEQLQ